MPAGATFTSMPEPSPDVIAAYRAALVAARGRPAPTVTGDPGGQAAKPGTPVGPRGGPDGSLRAAGQVAAAERRPAHHPGPGQPAIHRRNGEPSMIPPPFGVAITVVRRDVLNGRVWTAAAHRVLHDDGHKLVLVSWPGTVGYALTTWITWLTDGNGQSRHQAVADLAAGTWELGQWVWRDTIVVTWIGLNPDLSLQAYIPVDGGPTHWKINFERPVTRTPIGIDVCDLLLELMVDPATRTVRWKDEDEYA